MPVLWPFVWSEWHYSQSVPCSPNRSTDCYGTGSKLGLCAFGRPILCHPAALSQIKHQFHYDQRAVFGSNGVFWPRMQKQVWRSVSVPRFVLHIGQWRACDVSSYRVNITNVNCNKNMSFRFLASKCKQMLLFYDQYDLNNFEIANKNTVAKNKKYWTVGSSSLFIFFCST